MDDDRPGGYTLGRVSRHEVVCLRGLDIHLEHWCRASGSTEAPVLLLHGWQDTGRSFQFMIDAFGADLPMVAPDWRGFGRSAWSREGYWFADYLADLEALLDLLVPGEPARLVGHSMGANVASQYAGLRPERVRCLVNLEGFGMPPRGADEAPDRIVEWLDQVKAPARHRYYESVAQLTAVVRCRYPRFTPAQAAFIARAWSEPADDSKIRLVGDPRHRWTSPMRIAYDEMEACWRRARAPVLMVLGEDSEFVLRRGLEATEATLRARMPQARIARVAGAGHMLHIERAAAVAALVEPFLRAH